MRAVIRVQPTSMMRQPFARWAVAQSPKIRMWSQTEFAVPADLFPGIPEGLLVGATVDGQPYVPVTAAPPAEPVVAELVAPAEPAVASEPAEPAPLAEEPAEPTAPVEPMSDEPAGQYPCGGCDRTFGTERGRLLHQRKTHGGE